ncbi:MAG TPA: DinB family protein [Dehalococcoidia bacterium]|nr:DinB family protein [Dehalococcoidia bacterium]
MDIRDFEVEALNRTRAATLRIIQDVSQEQLRWQPAPLANHIGFLLFHIFRVDDRYFHSWIAKSTEVWERDGWASRWQLPSPPSNPDPIWQVGNSWTPEEVASWEPPSLAELLEYGAAVRESALNTVRDLDLSRLGETPRPQYPEWTVSYYLHQAIRHEAQHQGQIDYILGLMKAGS